MAVLGYTGTPGVCGGLTGHPLELSALRVCGALRGVHRKTGRA